MQFGVGKGGGICEPLTISLCQGLSYNQTLTPNQLGHASQRDAAAKMSFFHSIAQTTCSADIRPFLCAAYAPRCSYGQVRRPCRSFCQKARDSCEARLGRYGVSWPQELRCDAFPLHACVSVCICIIIFYTVVPRLKRNSRDEFFKLSVILLSL